MTPGAGAQKRLCIDLCSGRGGFSRAFVVAGWEVVTVDIDPKFHPVLCKDVTEPDAFYRIEDVTELGRERMGAYDKVAVLASPPCQKNSIANARVWLKGIGQGLRIAAGCTDIIAMVVEARGGKETDFALENPKGRLRWFMGKPNVTVRLKNYGYPTSKPTDIWTNLKLPMLESDAKGDGGRHNFPFR